MKRSLDKLHQFNSKRKPTPLQEEQHQKPETPSQDPQQEPHEEMEFEDEFEDEYEEEIIEQNNDDEQNEDEEDQLQQKLPKTDEQTLNQREVIEEEDDENHSNMTMDYDNVAYNMFHRITTEWYKLAQKAMLILRFCAAGKVHSHYSLVPKNEQVPLWSVHGFRNLGCLPLAKLDLFHEVEPTA